jgi:hypothetical protein
MTSGRIPGIIVYVKTAGRPMREFQRFCSHRGIETRLVDTNLENHPDAWECVGSVPDLERLIDHPSVLDWHYIMNVRPPRFGGKNDSHPEPIPKDVSASTARAIRLSKLCRAEREAAEEIARRKRLTAEERSALELAELNEIAALV